MTEKLKKYRFITIKRPLIDRTENLFILHRARYLNAFVKFDPLPRLKIITIKKGRKITALSLLKKSLFEN